MGKYFVMGEKMDMCDIVVEGAKPLTFMYINAFSDYHMNGVIIGMRNVFYIGHAMKSIISCSCMVYANALCSTSHFKDIFFWLMLEGENRQCLDKRTINHYLPKKFLNRHLNWYYSCLCTSGRKCRSLQKIVLVWDALEVVATVSCPSLGK